ncbi:MAG: PP2C family protein-serine/threonine phosphatase, partial [Bacteroidia bacterium]
KDGMDGILCCFEMQVAGGQLRTLRYSASNNAPLLIRDGEIVPLEKDKMPVGKGELTEPFHLYSVDLKKGDHLYLFTDGYADQFGGPKGKKFKYKQLAETILGSHTRPMSAQKEILEKTFSDWKGPLEQVDDVLVIGIRI